MTIEFSTEILAVVTLVLALATTWMAYATQKMAGATESLLRLESRPYLTFKDPRFHFLVDAANTEVPATRASVRIGIRFKNSGRVPVRYKVRKMHVEHAGISVDKPKFETVGGTVDPGEEMIYFYDTIRDIEFGAHLGTGKIHYEIEYGAGLTEGYVTARTIRYTIHSKDYVEWLNIGQSDIASADR